jgi:hypothetical protein
METEEITGMIDPEAAFKNGEYVKNLENTPYNPKFEAVMLDEVARGSDPMFDVFLDILDRQDVDCVFDANFVISTANFAIEGERTEALNDRIGLWIYLPYEAVDPVEFMANYTPNQKPELLHDLPTWDQIVVARKMKPGKDARAAVSLLVVSLFEAAMAQGHRVNRRTMTQWADLLYRYSFLLTGDSNFREVPKRAAGMLRYAWAAFTENEADEWQAIVNEIVDLVGTAIGEVMQAAQGRFVEMSKANEVERIEMMLPLGSFLTEQMEGLQKVGKGNPAVDDACALLKKWYSLACNGVDITEMVWEG